MSRPARPGQEPSARMYVLSNGEYMPKHQEESPVILLRSGGTGNPVHRWVPLAKEIFAKGHSSVFVLDIEALMKEVPSEKATSGLGPVLKPMSRLLQKLNPVNATLVALSATCGLCTKLMRQDGMRDNIARLVLIQPEGLMTHRSPLPEPPVPQHIMQIGEWPKAQLDQWVEQNGGCVTASVVPKATAAGGLIGVLTTSLMEYFGETQVLEERPAPQSVGVVGGEIIYTQSPFTKATEATVRTLEMSGAAAGGAAPKGGHADPQPQPTAAPAAAPAVQAEAPAAPAKPVRAPLAVTVPEWWEEDRSEFFASDSHVWSVRPGATVHNMEARVVQVECAKDGSSPGFARVADVNGSVRVAFHGSCPAHVAAFQIGEPVSLTGRVLTDDNGCVYISVPPEPEAVSSVEEDELTVTVGDKGDTTAQMAQEVGVGCGDVRHRVGCVLLRGSKIALVRRKDRVGRTELVVPSNVPQEEETPEATAMRTLTEALDVDIEEFRLAQHLGSVTRFPEQGVVETLYFAFATSAPPGGASKDKVDLPVDSQSPYDWFSFKHALRALSHEWHSVLWEVARRVHGAHKAGIVMPQWRCGVFGVSAVEEDMGYLQETTLSDELQSVAAKLVELAQQAASSSS